MSGIAISRLSEERKNWRRDHPAGFYARPATKKDGSTDLLVWETGIPGREGNVYCFVGIPSLYASIILLILEGTDWEGGVYKVIVSFPDEYPSKVVTMRYTLFSTVEKNSLLFLYSHLIANLCRQFSIQTFLLQVIRLSFSQQKKLF